MKDNLSPKNLKARLKGEMPSFWIKIAALCGAIAAGSGIILGSNVLYPNVIPAWIITACGYGLACGGFGGALTFLTKK